MLKTTRELIDYLKQQGTRADYGLVNAYVNAVLVCGNADDLPAVLAQYIAQQGDFIGTLLLPIVEKWGTANSAQQLFETCFAGELLKENIESELLEVLGNLQFSPIRPILIKYAVDEVKNHSYYHGLHATKGLLNFDCSDIEERIRAGIESTYGQNFFPEFLPALVGKIADNAAVIEALYNAGNTSCSTDCNSGIVLGISLCGEKGLPYFKALLFNPNWDAWDGATGTVNFAYEGTINLGLKMGDLYRKIKTIENPEQLRYAVRVLLALLERKIQDYSLTNNKFESFRSIYEICYQWEDDDVRNNLVDLAGKVKMEDKAYELERLLEMRVKEEVLIGAWTAQ